MGVISVGELKPSISGKRSFRSSSSIRHATEWPISDVSSDLTVEVGTSSFSLHKFPLVSRSGRIRKLVLESKDSSNKVSKISLGASVPGGAETFELAAKFCYGLPIEITFLNVAALRCAATFLEMTEDFAEKNLEARTESFLKDSVLSNIPNSIAVLHRCESLLPVAEDSGLVARLINAVASNACKEQLASGLQRLDNSFSAPALGLGFEPEPDWWGKALAGLGIEIFRRVVSAVKTKGLRQDIISRILVQYYAQNSLPGPVQRPVAEAMVGLLPSQSRKSAVPMAFLSSLLKAAMASGASAACRSDLERRIGLQLDQAILEDVLVPSAGGTASSGGIYDTDVVIRIFSVFLNIEEDEDDDEDECLMMMRRGDGGEMGYDFESPVGSPKQSSILKVSKLLDNYLAEVALDSNLSSGKFIALAELLPDHARIISDGLYRAVDIFLKVHPNIKESDRYRLCKTIDCQKLSQEGCSHAAQNERLPVQMAVQVLYFEQIRLRNAMNGAAQNNNNNNPFFFAAAAVASGHFPHRSGSGAGSGAISPRDNYASVRRENRELKLEVARMRMRLTDLEKDHVTMKQGLVRTRSAPAHRLFRSLAKKLNGLFRARGGGGGGSESRFGFHKRRRHSVS